MIYDGNNYAIHHSALFYVCFVAAMITATALMLGLFLLMVGRGSQATRRSAADAPADTPADATPEDAATPGSSWTA
jgi:hypothetical protein